MFTTVYKMGGYIQFYLILPCTEIILLSSAHAPRQVQVTFLHTEKKSI